jgi:diketogulonate reductase-like aldo/keto reductase
MDVPKLTLNDGSLIPQIGLGLWQITDAQQFTIMFDAAINAGYKHFDSAQVYHNEQLLGSAIQRHGIARQSLFITTKIYNFAQVEKSFNESLQKLKTEYVDLLLLHFPIPLLRSRAWRNLELLQTTGKVRSIGVSNYTIRHLEYLKRHAKVVPAVNQIEQHIFLQQPDLIQYCADNGIIIEAYSPLAHARNVDSTVIKQIAHKYDKSYAQIMLRWCVEQGMIVLPKSVTPSRLEENIQIFDFQLDASDHALLAEQNRNLHTCGPTKLTRWMP